MPAEYDHLMNRIDEVTGDAMRHKPGTGDEESDERGLALLLDQDQPRLEAFRPKVFARCVKKHVADIAGAESFDFGIATLWVGGNSRHTHRRNEGACVTAKALLHAISEGGLAAPDRVRDHARTLLGKSEELVVCGAAVLAGQLDKDGQPQPLPRHIADWFDEFAAREYATRTFVEHLRANAEAVGLGIVMIDLTD